MAACSSAQSAMDHVATLQQPLQSHQTSSAVGHTDYSLLESPRGVYVVGHVGDSQAQIVRIVHLADTQGFHWDFVNDIPRGHILVYSGGFATHQARHRSLQKQFRNKKRKLLRQLARMNLFFEKLPHPYKIFVAGNEDTLLSSLTPFEIQQRLPSAIYLQDNSCRLYGLKFFGSPWNVVPCCSLAPRGFATFSSNYIRKKWRQAAADTDILVTNMHPWDHPALYQEVTKRIRPIVHLFSDDHEIPGINGKDEILFSNGSLQGKRSCSTSESGSFNSKKQRKKYPGSSGSSRYSPERRYVNMQMDHRSGARPQPIVIDVYVLRDDFNYVERPLYFPTSDQQSSSKGRSSLYHLITNYIHSLSIHGTTVPTTGSSPSPNSVPQEENRVISSDSALCCTNLNQTDLTLGIRESMSGSFPATSGSSHA